MYIIHLRLITVYSHLCSHIFTFTVPSRKVEKYLCHLSRRHSDDTKPHAVSEHEV